MLLFKLAASHLLVRRTRSILTISAIALAVSLVVATTSGYRSVEGSIRDFLEQFFGSADVEISRVQDVATGVPRRLVQEFRDDPDIVHAVGRLETTVLIRNDRPEFASPIAPILYGVDIERDSAIARLELAQGRWFRPGEEAVIVVDQGMQQRMNATVGSKVSFPGRSGDLELTVVGIVRKPGILTSFLHTAYVPLDTLRPWAKPENPDVVSKVRGEFRTQVNAEEFLSRWREKLKAIDPALQVKLTRETREEMDRLLLGFTVMSYLGGTISMLAATFIVFSTVSMGVAERQRTLAMMRAVGLLKNQVGRLVLLEAVMLAVVGVALGVPLGMLWIKLLVTNFEHFFTAGAFISWGGVTYAAVGSILSSVVACSIPAIAAMRLNPLEAMNPLGTQKRRSRSPLYWAIIGLALIAIDSLLVFVPWQRVLQLPESGHAHEWVRAIRFYGHLALGLPALMLGFFLVAPSFVWLVERALGPVVALFMGVRFTLLRQQLSGGIWRAAGTACALMVGLAVLVVMQTQGNTTLQGWRLPTNFPDVFIYTQGSYLDPATQEKIRNAPGIRPGETFAVAYFSPELGDRWWAIAGASFLPKSTMFIAVDPDRALDMMELDFKVGDRETAKRLLKEGRHVLITEEFRQLRPGLAVGDTFAINSRTKGRLEYRIAGVVWSPGIDVMVSTFDLGPAFEQRSAASVFGSLEDARRDFGIENVAVIAANLETDPAIKLEREQLVKLLEEKFGVAGVRVADVRKLKYDLTTQFSNILLLASTVSWAAMAVASLGVTNTMMASVRSRRWQFGVLRALGTTRSSLLRLVLAESVLLGLIACAIGLACGLTMAVNARGMSRMVIGFNPPIQVPWGLVFIGMGVVMLISLAASLIPAWTTSRAEPLSLLQAGRAST